MTYEAFKAEWTGRRVDYDHVYAYQCVDLILEYLKECYGIPSGVTGNAIDYWNNPSAPLSKKFDRIKTTNCKPGDIVVFNGNPGNPYGHIGICDHQDIGNVWLLEQNGATGDGEGTGNDAISVWRSIPKSRIAGILRAKAAPSAPQPVYTTTKPGWGLSLIAKTAGFKDWWLPTAWIRISKLNGYGSNWLKMNSKLQPNQKVRVK